MEVSATRLLAGARGICSLRGEKDTYNADRRNVSRCLFLMPILRSSNHSAREAAGILGAGLSLCVWLARERLAVLHVGAQTCLWSPFSGRNASRAT